MHISRSTISSRINKTGAWRYVRPIFDNKTAPCRAACPAGEDIPRIQMLAAAGKYQDALSAILSENPLPAVCGHVCFHPCENVCNRSFFDQRIRIHHLERFIGNLAAQGIVRDSIDMKASNGRRTAILGAGPSGLSAAYFLRRLGYDCDVFEAEASAGGLLRWGIPIYRIPPGVLEKEVARIEGLGVRFYLGRDISRDFMDSARDLYHALFVGCGRAHPVSLNIPGEPLATDGLDFLKYLRSGGMQTRRGVAAVIGGGNTAVDVARSLLRLGASPVILYRRREADMPAFADEIHMARQEGVRIRECVAPIRIQQEGEDLLLTLQKMTIRGIDSDSGRARVQATNKACESLRVQHVFTAIGAEPEPHWSLPPVNRDGMIKLQHCSVVMGDLPVVYGGDLTNGSKSVADAIASGKAAAMAIDTCLTTGRGAVAARLRACRVGEGPALSMAAYMADGRRQSDPHIVSYQEINTDYFALTPGPEPKTIPLQNRLVSFETVNIDYSARDALDEARRCFNCGTCTACDNCALFCPEAAVLSAGERQIDLDYCKGCGICVVECPRNAMTLKGEQRETDS